MGVLTPFIVAAFLAYLADPLVTRLVRLKVPRTLAATLVFVVTMTAVIVLLLFLIPLLINQLVVFFNRIPELLAWIQLSALPWLNQHLNLSLALDLPTLKTAVAQHWQQVGNVALQMWTILSQSGLAFLEFFAKLLLIPVVTFYLLRDWDNVILLAKQLLPQRIAPRVISLICECEEVVGAFFRGQLLVMLGLAIIYSLGLTLVGLDIALLVGVIAGVLAIVPYLGIIVGVTIAGIAALMQFHDGIHLMYIGIVFLVGHLVENMVLTPWLVGDRIGLHPVAVIFAILLGGHFFGFVGILLALPVAAIVMVLLRHLKQYYVHTEFYRQAPAATKPAENFVNY